MEPSRHQVREVAERIRAGEHVTLPGAQPALEGVLAGLERLKAAHNDLSSLEDHFSQVKRLVWTYIGHLADPRA